MASFTLPITAISNTNAKSYPALSAAVLLQGQIAYQNPTTKALALARANADATAAIAGMVRNGAGAANTLVDVLTDGDITGLTGIVVGAFYALAPDVAGNIILLSELVTGNRISIFGYGLSSTSIRMKIINTGLVVP